MSEVQATRRLQRRFLPGGTVEVAGVAPDVASVVID
jgi:hypothetical protein